MLNIKVALSDGSFKELIGVDTWEVMAARALKGKPSNVHVVSMTFSRVGK